MDNCIIIEFLILNGCVDFEEELVARYVYVCMGNEIFIFSAPPNDDLRLDIVLPGERCIYIRAASREERQRWLVALGNSRRDNPQHSGTKY